MALIGGGGSGNVAGGNPSGTGTSLNYIGDHAYATSGPIISTTGTTTALEFNTGNSYIIALIQFAGYTRPTDASDGVRGLCSIIINSEKVADLLTDYDTGNMMETSNLKILLPPQSNIKIEAESSDNTGNFSAYVVLTGRVYG
jgi:hypothetical protein